MGVSCWDGRGGKGERVSGVPERGDETTWSFAGAKRKMVAKMTK